MAFSKRFLWLSEVDCPHFDIGGFTPLCHLADLPSRSWNRWYLGRFLSNSPQKFANTFSISSEFWKTISWKDICRNLSRFNILNLSLSLLVMLDLCLHLRVVKQCWTLLVLRGESAWQLKVPMAWVWISVLLGGYGSPRWRLGVILGSLNLGHNRWNKSLPDEINFQLKTLLYGVPRSYVECI